MANLLRLVKGDDDKRSDPDQEAPDPDLRPETLPLAETETGAPLVDAPAQPLARPTSQEIAEVPAANTDVAVPEAPEVDDAPQITVSVISRERDLRPIVPGWMRSWSGWRGTTRWWLRRLWHSVRFHAFRLPTYLARIALRAPLGLWRVLAGLTLWVLDVRTDGLEQQLATGTKSDTKEFLKLRENRGVHVRARLASVAAVALVAVAAVWVAWVRSEPWPWSRWAAAGFVVVVLALVGSSRSKPLLGQTMVVSNGFREITDVIVMRALRAAGLGGVAPKVDKDGNELTEDTRPTLAAAIQRSSNGLGTEILVDLPFGKTAGDAAEAVERLASGFDVSATQVFPEPVETSSRRVMIYVAEDDPMLLPPRRSPNARMPKVSVWDPQRIGGTPNGREVRAPILFNSFLIGAVPRAGKSFLAKNLITPAILDPWCDVTALDCKGGKDWLPTSAVAVDFQAGDEEEDLAADIVILERRQAEARERMRAFRTMSNVELPEDKLTRELAASGMRPHVVIVDEIQNLLRSPNKEIRTRGLELLVWFAKTAPSAGFVLVAITQRPAADVVPSDLRDILTVRMALRTKTPQSSDAILGAYISAKGFRSDRFLESHKGAVVVGGIPTGRGGDLQVMRGDLLMPAEYDRACQVGRQRRIDAGTLIGAAAGEATDITITVTVLEHVEAVWPGTEAKVQAHELVGRLRQVYGDRYAELDAAGLTRALKPHGVPVVQILRDGNNRNGYALEAVRKASKRMLDGNDE